MSNELVEHNPTKMSSHEDNIKMIEDIISRIGENAFKVAINDITKRSIKTKQATCSHDWSLSQIAGDGYNCHRCGSWKPED